MRLGVGLNDRTRCRGVSHTPHRAPPSVANTRPRAFIHSGPWGPFGGRIQYAPTRVRAFVTCIRPLSGASGGRMPLRPGVSPPRVSPWAMVHRAYSPAGYVPFGSGGPFGLLVRVPVRPVGAPDHSPGRNPGRRNPWCVDDRGETPGGPGTRCGRIRSGRVRPIRAPGTGRIHVPGYDHSSLAGCLVGRMQYAPTRVVHSGPFGYPAKFAGVRRRPPLPWYVHSGPFGYPAKFAGVRRRPPLHGYVHSGPFGYPASFPAPAGAVRRRPEASETLKQLVWAFPRPRKP